MRAVVGAIAVVAVANAWVGARLEALVPESSLDNLLELERRVARFPDKAGVTVLVFGNSHAVAGLRPPAIAEAIGVRPDAIFSLALPGASPREMRLLAERHLGAFPNVRQALCGIDEYFLGASIDARVRYLTRHSLEERWRYAGTFAGLDDRIGLMAGLALPVADFAVPLRAALAERPARTLERLVVDAPPAPDSRQGRLAAAVYRWGYPPPWDDPALARAMAMDWNTGKRAWHLMAGAGAGRVPTGVTELEGLARLIEGRGVRLTLAELPYTEPLAAALQANRQYQERYRRPLSAYLAAAGRAVVPAPVAATRHFYDLDHMNPDGARLMAGWLKKRLVGRADVQIGGRP